MTRSNHCSTDTESAAMIRSRKAGEIGPKRFSTRRISALASPSASHYRFHYSPSVASSVGAAQPFSPL